MIENMITKVNIIGDWVYRLAYVNILWLFFSLLGLVILGIFPATASMYTVIRKWMNNEEVSVFRVFSETYRKEFMQSNIIGWILLLMGLILWLDFMFLGNMQGIFYNILTFILLPITFIYLSVLFFIFPVFVHFQLNKSEYFKYAFIISLSYPHYTLLMIIGSIILLVLFITFPLLFPLLSGSTIGLLNMLVSKWIFKKRALLKVHVDSGE
ncbi:DUF624 domain-containing protein [Bacillus timonensis]|uniref:DUF624 domain-containing protein n=1 Tax=Bacillus timonensis TaxID=1033734 RepID=A0A4S3PMW0_9BACI|nr:DUF624 domain-containing protein [Bacillus timonensis]THE10839.1 DUF624 domain-containing protein [Bacillus timonensis]